MRTAIRNATVLDTATMTFDEGKTVVVDDGLIVDVDASSVGDVDIDIDAAGRYLVPGLIDAHVHFRLTTLDFRSLTGWTEVEFGIAMARLARETVERGFTTVRDLGGDVNGLKRAIERGAAVGPRIVRAGLMMSQTGGHGDRRAVIVASPTVHVRFGPTGQSIVADGPDAVLKASRHLLRDGSDFLKIHVSGGVATPSDPIDSLQYTPAEVRAAVTEATNRGTYVAAHAYLPDAIAMAVREGVRSIEHGNLIDDETARLVAESDAVMVPTLVTYKAMHDFGVKYRLPKTNLDKNTVVYESGLASLEKARAAGITLGFGTDLIGETQIMQNQELAIRATVEPAASVLHSMWVVNARLCRLEGRIGVVAPGAHGDLVLSKVNPLEDLAAFADHGQAFTHVLQAGVPVVDRS
ncbi:MAG: amidohydrolase family protein [Acidimicrobiales bacterium]